MPLKFLHPGLLAPQIQGEPLLALSWKQPFASLMLHGKIETRVWNTHFRGWVLICASQKVYKRSEIKDIAGSEQYDRIFNILPESHLFANLGHAIAIGYLADCDKMIHDDEDKCFVSFNRNLYCHVYKEVHAIKPIPWKGQQKFKVVLPDILQQIIII